MSHLWLIWLIPAPIMVYFFVRYVQGRKSYVFSAAGGTRWTDPAIIFQICSKDCPPIVGEAVRRVHEACGAIGYTNYRVDVVTDEPHQFDGVDRMIVVPSTYRPQRDCKYKAKSLQFVVEQRIAAREAVPSTWIFLLDEESFVSVQTVQALLSYLDQPAPPPISEGPITYPHAFFEVNPLCAVMECLRPYVCYDCVALMRDGGPTHLHGSNLLVRSDIEAQVQWDHKGVDLAEDQRFALEARLRLSGPIFGWHGGILEEQPALRIRDAIRQRQRWFVGNIHNLMYCPIAWQIKATVGLRWATWGIGFLAGLVSMAVLVIPQDIPIWLRIPLLLTTGLWLLAYQIGGWFNLQPHHLLLRKRVLYHVVILVLSPLAGLIDSWAAFTAPLHMIGATTRVPTPKMMPTVGARSHERLAAGRLSRSPFVKPTLD
jgi:egghead protein (zeste-white 4 protein)